MTTTRNGTGVAGAVRCMGLDTGALYQEAYEGRLDVLLHDLRGLRHHQLSVGEREHQIVEGGDHLRLGGVLDQLPPEGMLPVVGVMVIVLLCCLTW